MVSTIQKYNLSARSLNLIDKTDIFIFAKENLHKEFIVSLNLCPFNLFIQEPFEVMFASSE